MDTHWNLVERRKKVYIKQAADTVKFLGHDINKLEECWIIAVRRFFAPGGGAEQV